MIGSTATLSLADVARLAGVQRPVVSMWRTRDRAGMPFPAADEHGRFDAIEIVDWLERTGRGNNPEARADLAVQAALSASVAPQRRRELLVLLAARALLDEPLASYDLDELVDEVDAVDPDDDYLFREVDALDRRTYPALAAQVDAIAEAAWNPRAAYERLHEVQPDPDHDERWHPDLCELLVGLCRALVGPGGDLVDVEGKCDDVVIAACAQEDLPALFIRVPGDAPARGTERRYRVHGLDPARCALQDSWGARPGSVNLVRVADREGFELIDEARLQLSAGSVIIAVGPASLLTDSLEARAEALRDEFIRQERPQPAVLRAAVRLPRGLTRGGGQRHLALWLLGPAPQRSPIWVGDISGARLDRAGRQTLLDDLLAVFRPLGLHSFAVLQAASRATIAANGGSLVSTGRAAASAMVAAADDAARLDELRRALAVPLPEVLGWEPVAVSDGVPRRITLGDAHHAGRLRLLPGTRMAEPAPGGTPLWTAEAVAERRAASVDLLDLTQRHPDIRLTEPRDVVFTTAGRPRAVLDLAGGAAVAYPARVLRIEDDRLCPAAVVDAINAVPAGNAKWRTWAVPEVQIDPGVAGEILETLQGWEDQLWQRQALLDELRLLITRSVLSGAVTVTSPHEQKGR